MMTGGEQTTESIAPTQTTSQSVEPTIVMECPGGEELTGDTCTACRSGFFKSRTGTENCQRCPTNTESFQEIGSTSCRKRYSFSCWNNPKSDQHLRSVNNSEDQSSGRTILFRWLRKLNSQSKVNWKTFIQHLHMVIVTGVESLLLPIHRSPFQ